MAVMRSVVVTVAKGSLSVILYSQIYDFCAAAVGEYVVNPTC